MPRLFRVKLDDELLANVQIDLIALRKSKYATLKFLDVNLEPSRHLNTLVRDERALDDQQVLGLRRDGHEVAGLTRNDGMSTRRPFTTMWP